LLSPNLEQDNRLTACSLGHKSFLAQHFHLPEYFISVIHQLNLRLKVFAAQYETKSGAILEKD
jgi:hypothetical protein